MKTKTTIKSLLLINEETYFWKVINAGVEFAEFYWAKDAALVKAITETTAYWDWWRNQFDQQNEVFINRYQCYRCDEKKLYQEWESCLEPEAVIAYPCQYVIDEALKMFDGFYNEQHAVSSVVAKKTLSCKKP